MTHKHILVTYATKVGSTAEVAQAIGETLRHEGLSVDVRSIDNAGNLNDYDGVVIGSAIRMGNWLASAKNFLKANQSKLRQMPVAYFTVCLTMAEDTPENREKTSAFLEPVRAIHTPQAEGFFGGQYDPQKLPIWWRFFFSKSDEIPEGDFRDWNAIQQWAVELVPVLTGKAIAA